GSPSVAGGSTAECSAASDETYLLLSIQTKRGKCGDHRVEYSPRAGEERATAITDDGRSGAPDLPQQPHLPPGAADVDLDVQSFHRRTAVEPVDAVRRCRAHGGENVRFQHRL